MFKIRLLAAAKADLRDGARFYDSIEPGLGRKFIDNVMADLSDLRVHAGVHVKPLQPFHRALMKRFPFGIYYVLNNNAVEVYAVLDCRQDPSAIHDRLMK